MTTTLRVHEVFHSLQGESSHAGRRCVFIRLTGCNLRCAWCDTKEAYEGGDERTVDGLVAEAVQYGCSLVEVTGGEPLLQPGALTLLRRLCDEGLEVLLETNGARPTAGVDPRVTTILDIKCPSSGEATRMIWDNLAHLRPRDEVKFVLADRNDYRYACQVMARHGLLGRSVPPLLSAVWGRLEPATLARWVLEDRLDVRVQVQLHKVIWGPDARGV